MSYFLKNLLYIVFIAAAFTYSVAGLMTESGNFTNTTVNFFVFSVVYLFFAIGMFMLRRPFGFMLMAAGALVCGLECISNMLFGLNSTAAQLYRFAGLAAIFMMLISMWTFPHFVTAQAGFIMLVLVDYKIFHELFWLIPVVMLVIGVVVHLFRMFAVAQVYLFLISVIACIMLLFQNIVLGIMFGIIIGIYVWELLGHIAVYIQHEGGESDKN